MSQVNNRNASAGKRARTDGGRREDDWTCPSCGNVNFSFRTTCNMHSCTQSRPADHNTSAMKPLQAPSAYASSTGYMGPGAPTSMYLGGSPYGSSVLNGPSLSPYNLRYAGGSAYPFGYGSRSVGSPYGPLHMPGSPYSSGSMMGPGGMYGMPPLMDRYGMGVPMGHGAMGPRPGAFPEESSQKKAAGAGREDDWTCPTCSNLNFAFRTVCNMRKCNTPRPGSQGPMFENSKGSKPKMPEGSWTCNKCNNINYPFRTKCNRQNCGAEKPPEENASNGLPADDDNQWTRIGSTRVSQRSTWALFKQRIPNR
ncbi:ranBP2-type zinc finger protein isoform X1 [Iris pallida]|uniref:RanBP2-type zinc finger protein isoform X1 n=1 Tax=Iris pallida TaxID=29817 RepID=A0AAX6DGG6_IRIPA|nr:ranBP2-type zinc finger protein isoform X1 [Iris pallida]